MKKKTLERDSRLRHTPVPGTKHNNYEENNRGYNSRNCKESKNGADKCCCVFSFEYLYCRLEHA